MKRSQFGFAVVATLAQDSKSFGTQHLDQTSDLGSILALDLDSLTRKNRPKGHRFIPVAQSFLYLGVDLSQALAHYQLLGPFMTRANQNRSEQAIAH